MNAYEEKKAARIERLRERAERKAAEASAGWERGHKMASVIPLGQPILVGHHSEKRDRAYRGKIHRTFERAHEATKAAQDLEARADAAESNNAISSDDPEAVEKLKAKLAGMEAQRDLMKLTNSAHRKFLKDPASLEASGLSENLKAKIREYKPQYSWEPHPIPPYAFANLNGNMARVRERIATLEAKVNRPVAEPIEGNGWRLVENAEANRLQIFFPGKPAVEVRAALKRNGFRWAPSEGAWQRQLTSGARWAAENVLKEIGGVSQ